MPKFMERGVQNEFACRLIEIQTRRLQQSSCLGRLMCLVRKQALRDDSGIIGGYKRDKWRTREMRHAIKGATLLRSLQLGPLPIFPVEHGGRDIHLNSKLLSIEVQG